MPRSAPQPTLADPGAMLSQRHELGNGASVRLRLTRPTDAELVRDFLERLDPETRRRRFLRAMPEVGDSTVRHFTFYDPRQRLVLAATAPIDGTERIVGLADVVLMATGLAEIGLVVDEDQREQGLGKLLSEVVAALALRHGATHLKAEIATEDSPIRGLMSRLGRTVTAVEQGDTVVYTKLAPLARRRAA